MKRILIAFVLIVMMGNLSFANDPIRLRPSERFLLELFTDIWQDEPENMDMNTINRGVGIYFLQDFVLGTSNFSFATGLGFASHNLYSDHYYLFDPETETYNFEAIQADYDKNKLSLNYIDVPVEIRFRTRTLPHTFRLHAGIKGGYMIQAHTKYEGGDEIFQHGNDIKFKEHNLDQIERFRFGITGRIGYGRVTLNAFMPLTDVFYDNNAEDMRPISVGLTFILF